MSGWRRSSVVRTSVFGRRTFPALLPIDGWQVTTLWIICRGYGGAEIARPDNSAPYCMGGHRETCFSVRVDAHYNFVFDSGSIIWAAPRFYVCSSISFCFTYCYVRQTKLASFLDNVWANYKIVIDCVIDWTTVAKCALWRHVLASHWCRADIEHVGRILDKQTIWAPFEFFAPSPLLRVRSWLHPF